MNVGILTHPLNNNYGGILQAYALRTYLTQKGYHVIIVHREIDQSFILIRWIRWILKTLHHPRYYHPNVTDRTKNIRPFVSKYFEQTDSIMSQRQMRKVCKVYNLDMVIVGSDQVWRRDFAIKFGFNYFLDFVPKDCCKVAYAASFGINDWQYTIRETSKIKSLLKTFNGISVREDEAVNLLQDNIGIIAKHLIDPTLLLQSENYDKIASSRKVKEKYIFAYWLGDKSKLKEILDPYYEQRYSIVVVNLRENKEQISIEDWLSYIKYADFVITDSYHGCVFSILYYKQFYIHKNDSGGNGRLVSLFRMLGIQDKLVNPNIVINYGSIDITLLELRQKANRFLMGIINRIDEK